MSNREIDQALDKLATGGLMLYTLNRAKGMSEPDSVFHAVRRTGEIFYEELAKKLDAAEKDAEGAP